MLAPVSAAALAIALSSTALAAPTERWNTKKSYYDYFDLQGHRGARGEMVER
jgi:hypothetical protein